MTGEEQQLLLLDGISGPLQLELLSASYAAATRRRLQYRHFRRQHSVCHRLDYRRIVKESGP